MVDESRGKATEGFCKEVIIMSYHRILTDEKASGARRKWEEDRWQKSMEWCFWGIFQQVS